MSVVMRGAIEAASRNGGLEHTAFNASASSSQVMQMIYNELGITSNEIFLNSVMLENVDVADSREFWNNADNVGDGLSTFASVFALGGGIAEWEMLNGLVSKSESAYNAISKYNRILGAAGKVLGVTGAVR
jgi:hypothetical protein